MVLILFSLCQSKKCLIRDVVMAKTVKTVPNNAMISQRARPEILAMGGYISARSIEKSNQGSSILVIIFMLFVYVEKDSVSFKMKCVINRTLIKSSY